MLRVHRSLFSSPSCFLCYARSVAASISISVSVSVSVSVAQSSVEDLKIPHRIAHTVFLITTHLITLQGRSSATAAATRRCHRTAEPWRGA